MTTSTKYTIAAQAVAVRRQFAFMRGVYPKLSAAGAIEAAECDFDLGAFEAAVKTMDWLEKHAKVVKQVAANRFTIEEGDMTPTQARRYALDECLAIATKRKALDVAQAITALINEPPLQKKDAANG